MGGVLIEVEELNDDVSTPFTWFAIMLLLLLAATVVQTAGVSSILLQSIVCDTATSAVVALRLCCSKSLICDNLEELANGVDRLIKLFPTTSVASFVHEGAVVVSNVAILFRL